MAVRKRIVCLANSRKLNGRCIAGRELLNDRAGPWIRPVSDREHQGVSEYERQYQDGRDPRVLDIIDIPLTEARSEGCQRENWLLDPEEYWVRSGRFPFSELGKLVDRTDNLWPNGHHTYNGRNDRIPVDQAADIPSSLKLVRVDTMQLKVFAPGEAFDNPKRRVQARFQSGGDDYWLRVTDPVVERAYLARQDGDYPIDRCFLTVSLGEPYNGFIYKLVAAVITPDRESDAR